MRFKLKKSSWITKLVILIVLIYAMVTMVCLQRQLSEKQSQHAELDQQLSQVLQSNAKLRNGIDALDTEEGIEAIAREKLGLVSKGEITFYDIGG